MKYFRFIGNISIGIAIFSDLVYEAISRRDCFTAGFLVFGSYILSNPFSLVFPESKM